MIIRKSDLTAYAQDLGMWETLKEMADPNTIILDDSVEIEITAVKIYKN
jgi:hypothetical protein